MRTACATAEHERIKGRFDFWDVQCLLESSEQTLQWTGSFPLSLPLPEPVLKPYGTSILGFPLTSAGLASAQCIPVSACDSPLCLHLCLMCLFSLVPITAVHKAGIILHNASFFWLLSCVCLALRFSSKVTVGILSYPAVLLWLCWDEGSPFSFPGSSLRAGLSFPGYPALPCNRNSLELLCILQQTKGSCLWLPQKIRRASDTLSPLSRLKC